MSIALALSIWMGFKRSRYLPSRAVAASTTEWCSSDPGAVYFTNRRRSSVCSICATPESSSTAFICNNIPQHYIKLIKLHKYYYCTLTSSRWILRSIIVGMTHDRVVNSSPLRREVNFAKGCSRSTTPFILRHSLAAKSSQPCCSSTTFKCSFNSKRRFTIKKVELHLVGQSFINFFPR